MCASRLARPAAPAHPPSHPNTQPHPYVSVPHVCIHHAASAIKSNVLRVCVCVCVCVWLCVWMCVFARVSATLAL